jgi:hypothetical protein
MVDENTAAANVTLSAPPGQIVDRGARTGAEPAIEY